MLLQPEKTRGTSVRIRPARRRRRREKGKSRRARVVKVNVVSRAEDEDGLACGTDVVRVRVVVAEDPTRLSVVGEKEHAGGLEVDAGAEVMAQDMETEPPKPFGVETVSRLVLPLLAPEARVRVEGLGVRAMVGTVTVMVGPVKVALAKLVSPE